MGADWLEVKFWAVYQQAGSCCPSMPFAGFLTRASTAADGPAMLLCTTRICTRACAPLRVCVCVTTPGLTSGFYHNRRLWVIMAGPGMTSTAVMDYGWCECSCVCVYVRVCVNQVTSTPSWPSPVSSTPPLSFYLSLLPPFSAAAFCKGYYHSKRSLNSFKVRNPLNTHSTREHLCWMSVNIKHVSLS